jgi:glycosyltransferase involved in cell wall biosynthesis
VSTRGASRARHFGWQHRLLSPLTAATVACAGSQVDMLLREGVRRDRLALVPNGVPVAELRQAADNGGPSRGDLGVPADARLVMQVGRLMPEKDQQATVDAVARLRGRLGDVHAVFVGRGPDETAPRRARELGADWAHFLGGRTDVPALLRLADIAVLPSRVDAFPMVALEAMAVGVPQVTSDVGDLRAIVEGSGTGLSVAAGDLDAFTDACFRLLSDDAERARLAAEAAERAWGWDVALMVERYSVIFDAVRAGEPLPASSRP